ncbi:MAG: hypothetical protein LBG79_00645 [Spirochaetaceae bacterium]|jgi:hypothetical protein|nr:hypothetical protein [Spirochaetaceae bacterium]GMO18117.1 MAG: hypothetical protein Pg6A_04810 [Termitinemataceae bacterium]
MTDRANDTQEIINYDVNLNFLKQIKDSLKKNPQMSNIFVMPRDDDASVYTSGAEEQILLSFTV